MPLMRCTPVALMLTLVFIAGCAGVKPAPRVVVEDTHTIVRLDVDQSIKGPDDPDRYTHPAQIEVSQLRTIFDAVRIHAQRVGLQKKFSGQTAQHRVFEADEIARLAPIVKDAFTQASPQERVVFALSQPADTGLEATVGELYIKDHQLHFILHCYHLQTKDTDLISRCQDDLAPQGFELRFAQLEYFVSFGKASLLFGNSTKEIVIDFSNISTSPTSGS